MSALVLCRVVDPHGWAYLDAQAPVHGLTWQWDYPGGPTSAELSLDAPADAHIRHLSVGATLTIHRGGILWQGRVAEIDRDGWRVKVDGLAGLVAQEPVATTGSLDAIVDAAIADGLPLTRPASLSSTVWGQDSGGSTDLSTTTLDQPLGEVLTAEGKYWRVDLAGRITAETAPTKPALIVSAHTAPPLTLNTYATRITATYGTYDSGGQTRATVTVVDAKAEAKFGRVSRSIDLTRFGGISATSAQGKAQAYLNRVSPHMVVSGEFAVTPGQVTTASGGPVDLPQLRPGVVARIQLVTLVRDRLVVPTSAVDMLIGRVRYDADAGTAALSPTESAPDPLAVMFGGRATRTDLT
ncbi:MAG TPA: hypothetical protein VFJ12_05460 [Segeticoccus sp.]|nr:hypothetical protein [Segeticoccus sp.]